MAANLEPNGESVGQTPNQMQEQIEKTYEALKIILSDEETFNHVCMEVFNSIDINGDESLEKEEVVKFIETICLEMGLENSPDAKTISEVFKELDEDGSNEIDSDELKSFLRKIFICQRDEIAKAIGGKK